ncbi:MAG: 7-carboxy-7-deazaguanine synthase QueE [Cyanobacteria bacterium SID2]|nr:7-carboxy-7-deazaguanine synthase QueE [Cyanobacteria bacterium SID2]MBP0006459.1 7-carboxy-7-deazaguanine synthase QueE [Cyanobacteria bacterium SBC]
MTIAQTTTARLVEVFSAIQGEGLNIGTRQIFVRFALCDLRCFYCDSPQTWFAPASCRVERTPGLRDFDNYPNPVSVEMLSSWVERQNRPGLHESISITGGEPLLHAPFLSAFLPLVREKTKLPIYLETGGHRPQQLQLVLPYVDLVGMDIKLPSTSGETCWTEHEAFLKACREADVSVFTKIVVCDRTPTQELERAAQLIRRIDRSIPVFLQPVTPLNGVLRGQNETLRKDAFRESVAPSPNLVLAWQTMMKRTLLDVRVIPQTHKMLGQL